MGNLNISVLIKYFCFFKVFLVFGRYILIYLFLVSLKWYIFGYGLLEC